MRALRRRTSLRAAAPVGGHRHRRLGKSTLCARLAGTIPGAVIFDADILAGDLISVVPPKEDYVGFWRSMMRIAHGVAQNKIAVVYFSTMLPEQVLANRDVVGYFESVHFLCFTCSPDVLRARLTRRDGSDVMNARIQVWLDFDRALVAAASETPNATVIDAGRTVDEVEDDVRQWVNARLHGVGRGTPHGNGGASPDR